MHEPEELNDEQLLRYSRQIMLPQVGIEGQQRLRGSTALVVGLGGLGSPVAMYLAAAGVGHLILADDDQVDLSNLQRQILHRTEDIGQPKAQSAARALHALNPETRLTLITERLQGDGIAALVDDADVVIDGCDNFTTRFAINQACVATGTPLVSGAAIRMEGQVAVFRPGRADGPCYRCLYRDEGELDQRCSENGVMAPLVGIVGSIQAMEAVKILMGVGEDLDGRLLLLDAERMEWRTLKLRRDPECPVCGKPQQRTG